MFDETAEFQIVANGKFYAVKQGLPNPETYEQAIMWSEDASLATSFSYRETSLYLKKFKEILGDSYTVEYREVSKVQ